jgi:hypothetical protein
MKHEQSDFLNTQIIIPLGYNINNPLSTFVKTQRKLVKLSQEELTLKAGAVFVS